MTMIHEIGKDFYYDFQVNALRCWSDDSLISEPQDNCLIEDFTWWDNILVWDERIDSRAVHHVWDTNTASSLATVSDEKNRFVCATNTYYVLQSGDHCTLHVYDMTGELINTRKSKKAETFIGIYENELIIMRDELGKTTVKRYDFNSGQTELVETFSSKRLSEWFVSKNLLIFIVASSYVDANHRYDMWCYDLAQKKYLWKQYQVLNSEKKPELIISANSLPGERNVSYIEYNGKIEFAFCTSGICNNQYQRVIFNIEDGKILYNKKFMLSFHAPALGVMKRIDHTVLYFFFTPNERIVCKDKTRRIHYDYDSIIFDISEYLQMDLPYDVQKNENETVAFGDSSDQINEIIEKWNLPMPSYGNKC